MMFKWWKGLYVKLVKGCSAICNIFYLMQLRKYPFPILVEISELLGEFDVSAWFEESAESYSPRHPPRRFRDPVQGIGSESIDSAKTRSQLG